MKYTHRILAALMAVCILTALVAVGGMAKAGAVKMVNPMKEVTAEEMIHATGIVLAAPEGAEDIRCFTITVGDAVIAQMDFTLDGKAYTYRATGAELDITALSGVYFGKAEETEIHVSYTQGKLCTEGSTAVLFWDDRVPGFRYSLSCSECEDPAVLQEIAEATFHPMQGEDDGCVYVEFSDLEGVWTAEDGSTVTLTVTEAGEYDALVSICRLSQFPGSGELDPVRMNLTLEDPNGGTLRAEFHANEDGTGTLVITESTWNLLAAGTEFPGFARQSVN